MVKNLPADAENVKRRRFGPWVGKIPWSGAWQPTPAFLPENPMDRGAWRAIVHGVAESRTRLSRHKEHMGERCMANKDRSFWRRLP